MDTGNTLTLASPATRFLMPPNSEFKLHSEVTLSITDCATISDKMMNTSDNDSSTNPAVIDFPAKDENPEPSPEQNEGGDVDVDDGYDTFRNMVHSSDELPPSPAEVLPEKSQDKDGHAAKEEEEPNTDDAYIGMINSSDPVGGETSPVAEEEGPPTTEPVNDEPPSASTLTEDAGGNNIPSPSKANEEESLDKPNSHRGKAAEAATVEGDASGGEAKAISLDADEVQIDDPPAGTADIQVDALPDTEITHLERRASNEHKIKLRQNKLLSSATSVDSWGGKETISPLLGSHRHTMEEFDTTSSEILKAEVDVSDLGNGDNDESNNTEGGLPQDKAPRKSAMAKSGSAGNTEDDQDESASYINFNKLLEPSASTKYYYSQANSKNRKIIDKVKSKKVVTRSTSLDESGHSRVSMLNQRSTGSSYRGPTPVKKDGSKIQSAMKLGRTSSNSSNGLSIDSLQSPEKEKGEEEEETNNNPKTKSMRRCSFSCINIREHERVAGDNPCVTSGVPLSLGWGYYQHEPINLDDYETNKGPSRDKIEMMVPSGVRREMLRDGFGVTVSDMNSAMKEVNITKRGRRNTVATEHLEGWQEVAQSAKRKFKRFVKRTSTAKEQDKMWDDARKSAVKDYLKTHGEGSLGKNSEGPKGVAPKAGGQVAAAPLMEISFQQDANDEAPTF